MSDKVQYSIVNTEDGNISVQSVVKSFNLDHVTSKDIKSFYSNFSRFSAWDTGLLPVDGSGILAIRTAGDYTQFAYQHKPGLYHVNWAAREGDTYAAAYYLAQPYRIIICDMQDGNLLGARTFYSPYPITSPTQPLYHVNLPNINCKGYRGNGVGWICLYQNEDWSSLPLNERIVRFIERCSGVETYNDGNMSETDGTRFYQQHSKPNYTWDPVAWQEKSSSEGFEWTLDESLWIPILVKSMDDQGSHYDNGQPLTFADALVGDYQAYYYDKVHTKPINAVIRPDKELSSDQILSYFVKSYNSSGTFDNPLLNDTFNATVNLKSSKSSPVFVSSSLTNTVESHSEENHDNFYCQCCSDTHSNDYYGFTDSEGNAICDECKDNYYVWINNANTHFHIEDDCIVTDISGNYFHTEYDTCVECPSCETMFATSSNNEHVKQDILNSKFELSNGDEICSSCIEVYDEENSAKCDGLCGSTVLTASKYLEDFPTVSVLVPFLNDQGEIDTEIVVKTFCKKCSSKNFICPCGLIQSSDDTQFNPCTKTTVEIASGSTIAVTQACATCISPVSIDEDGNASATYVSINTSIDKVYLNSTPMTHPSINKGWHYEKYADDIF